MSAVDPAAPARSSPGPVPAPLPAAVPVPVPVGGAGSGRIPGLDGLRAVSVLIVFAAHAAIPLPVGAGTGVTVFFFLSGYLITTLLRREFDRDGRISIRNFYLRRSLRILPPLYLVVLIAIGLTLTGALAGALTWLGVGGAVLHFTNVIEVVGDPTTIAPGLGVLWSLAVEEHFYLIFPFCYLAVRRWLPGWAGAPVFAAGCLLVLIWRVVLLFGIGRAPALVYVGTDTRIDSLLFGCLLAVAPVGGLSRLAARPATALAAAVGGALLVVAGEHLPGRWSAAVGPTVQGIGLFVLVGVVVAAPRMPLTRLLQLRPLVWIGVLSYALYLVHRLIQLLLEQHTDLTTWPRAGLSLVLALVLSLGIHRFVERPCVGLKDRWQRRSGPASHPVRVTTHADHRPLLDAASDRPIG